MIGTRWQTKGSHGAGSSKARLFVGLALGAVIVLGGWVGFTLAVPRPGGAGSPGVSSLVSDPATVDPCGLVATASFDGLPAPTLDAHGDAIGLEHLWLEVEATSFNDCEVVVNGVRITVDNDAVGTDEIDASRFATSREGWLRVAKETRPLSAAQCHQYVYSDNGAAVKITAFATGLVDDRSGLAGGVNVCATTDRVTSAVVATIQSRQPPRIHYTPDSVGSRAPCGMLGLAAADAMRNARGEVSVGGHSCVWKGVAGTDSPWASLQVTLMKPDTWRGLLRQPAFGASKGIVAGRDSIVTRPTLDAPGLDCTVETAGRTWDPWPGYQIPQRPTQPGEAPATRSLTEIVGITVFLPSGTVDQACQQARAFAVKLWPTLPQPV